MIRRALSIVFALMIVMTPNTASTGFLSEDNEDIMCLATNIYFEARNQPLVGQIAVGMVTLNRVQSPKFPNTVCGVVYQAKMYKNWKGNYVPVRNKCQFSWYCDGLTEQIDDVVAWDESVALAEQLYFGTMIDITEGSTFYHNLNVDPYWNKHYYKRTKIDDHIFYAYNER